MRLAHKIDSATPAKLERQCCVSPVEAESGGCSADDYALMDSDSPTNWHLVPKVCFVELNDSRIVDA